ncbi:MAG: LPS export ABC transporter periplasmic protein LptC [Ginsengibacter sp.]
MTSLKINFLAAITMCCFFILGCENSLKEIRDATAKRIGVEEAKQVNINYSISGKTKARITAPLMLRYQDTVPYTEFPKTIHADFYNDSLVIESRLDARYARYMETENKVFLRDSVKVINRTGDTLYCNELYWDRSKTGKEFYTDKPVRIRTKTHIIDGSGMDAPQDFKDWHILHPTGFVKVPASQFPG